MRTRTGRRARLLRTFALAVTLCLLVTASPVFAAPAVAGSDGNPAVDRPAGLLHALGDALAGLWAGLTARVDRLFAANGHEVDPNGTAGSAAGTTTGVVPLDQVTTDNGAGIDPNG